MLRHTLADGTKWIGFCEGGCISETTAWILVAVWFLILTVLSVYATRWFYRTMREREEQMQRICDNYNSAIRRYRKRLDTPAPPPPII